MREDRGEWSDWFKVNKVCSHLLFTTMKSRKASQKAQYAQSWGGCSAKDHIRFLSCQLWTGIGCYSEYRPNQIGQLGKDWKKHPLFCSNLCLFCFVDTVPTVAWPKQPWSWLWLKIQRLPLFPMFVQMFLWKYKWDLLLKLIQGLIRQSNVS